MKITLPWLGMAIVLAGTVLSLRAQADVMLDLSNSHVFAGLGVNMWTSSDLPIKKRDTLISTLNIRAVRVSLTPKSEPLNLVSTNSVEDVIERINTRADNQWRQSVQNFALEARRLNLQVHAVFYSTPEPWRIDIPRGNNSTKIDRFAAPQFILKEANWITAVLEVAKQLGVDVSHVEIANEPDGSWNTKYDPDEYAELLLKTRRLLDSNGLSRVKIEGPGTSKISLSGTYLSTLKQRRQLSLLGAVSAHDWDTANGSLSEGATPVVSAMRRAGADLPLIITEYNDANPKWGQSPFETNPAKRGAHNGADSIEFGIASAAEALRLLSDGANQIFLWELEDQSWEGQSYGLVDTHGSRRPVAEAMKASVSQINPGSNIVGVKLDHGAVITASESTDDWVLIAANPGENPLKFQVELKGAHFHSGDIQVTYYPETKMGDVKFKVIGTSIFEIGLPTSSIVTIRQPRR